MGGAKMSLGGSSDDDSDGAHEDRGMGFLGMSEEPRTLSQIKRSQIDLDRRYVFLCPTSLSKDFDAIPQQAKENCLLIFKCNRDWLFSERADLRRRFASSRLDTGTARQRKHRGARRVLSPNARSAIRAVSLTHEFSKDFLKWVKDKEKQGDVFWYKPARDLKLLSRFLEDKVDPFTKQSYKKLKLDAMWWRTRFSAGRSRYVGSAALVIQSLQESLQMNSWKTALLRSDCHHFRSCSSRATRRWSPLCVGLTLHRCVSFRRRPW